MTGCLEESLDGSKLSPCASAAFSGGARRNLGFSPQTHTIDGANYNKRIAEASDLMLKVYAAAQFGAEFAQWTERLEDLAEGIGRAYRAREARHVGGNGHKPATSVGRADKDADIEQCMSLGLQQICFFPPLTDVTENGAARMPMQLTLEQYRALIKTGVQNQQVRNVLDTYQAALRCDAVGNVSCKKEHLSATRELIRMAGGWNAVVAHKFNNLPSNGNGAGSVTTTKRLLTEEGWKKLAGDYFDPTHAPAPSVAKAPAASTANPYRRELRPV